MNELTCDICGNNEATAIVLIEGAKMAACRFCARGGKILYKLEEDVEHTGKMMVTERRAEIETEDIADDYAKIVANAIAKLKVPVEVIAERINEKESYISAIERGRVKPTIQVARKLEKELGIKLVEITKEEVVPMSEKTSGKYKESTLADVLDFQKKKAKGK